MPSKTTNRVLTDHDEIRQWVEERGSTPAIVKGTGDEEAGDSGILRIDFPGYSGEDTLEPISWDEWFRKFDEAGLALVVQDYTASGERSNFNKIVSRETALAAERKSKRSSRVNASAGRTNSGGRASSSRSSNQARSAKRNTTTSSSSRSSGRVTAQKSSRGRKTAASSTRSQSNSKRRSTASSKGSAKKKSGGSVRSISTGSRKSGATRSRSGQGGGRKAA
jgi:hypothetical protein